MAGHSKTSALAISAMLCALAGALLFGSPVSLAQTPSRGELLYSTHCIACHNSQMHWRDKRLATDWASLEALVRRWQAEAKLHWTDDDIAEVTRHLNRSFYRFVSPAASCCGVVMASRR
jgi:hypothetical protein